MHIIDRRLNPGSKGLEDRQRFLQRSKKAVRNSVSGQNLPGSIKDINQGGKSVSIPSDGISEPYFQQTGGDSTERIFPGNKEYVQGDVIYPKQSQDCGSTGAGEGDDMDAFRFILNRDEFLNVFFDDLELPDLARKLLIEDGTDGHVHAGYTTAGSPANLALPPTFKNSLKRRIALKRPKLEDIEALKKKVEECIDEEEKKALQHQLEVLERKRRAIHYIEEMDIRYRAFIPRPRVVPQAVMFCLMDVSGSMNENMKDLAKRFYALLYLFLRRTYKHVELVFIQHTEKAQEVGEQEFFEGQASGGTAVSAALIETSRIITERFAPADWNIYVAQASDGDNGYADNEKVASLLQRLVPILQYYAYIEVSDDNDNDRPESSLWALYKSLQEREVPIAIRKVQERAEIFPVFADLFRRRESAA